MLYLTILIKTNQNNKLFTYNIYKNENSINTILSLEETYENIEPVRINSNGITAFISIMRGCDNMCSFCVVPYTRGRERSRNPHSIINEAKDLFNKGYREITLLGQNVDSFKWSPSNNNKIKLEKHSENKDVVYFSDLLEMTANISPDLRIRFSTSHPKDITSDVLSVIKKYENVCNYIHLPAQSGNSRILKKMNRTYDRNWYLNKISDISSLYTTKTFNENLLINIKKYFMVINENTKDKKTAEITKKLISNDC